MRSAPRNPEAAREEYWRLQQELEAMPQAEYDSHVGDRLSQQQQECHRVVAEDRDDERWNERDPWAGR